MGRWSGIITRIGVAGIVLAVGAAGCGAAAEPDVDTSPSPSPTGSPFAPADFAAVGWLAAQETLAELGLEPLPPDDPDRIAAPGFIWELHELAVTSAFDPEQLFRFVFYPESRDLPEGIQQAGPGREFLVAWIQIPREAPRPDDRSARINLAVRVEDQPYHSLGQIDPAGGAAVLVSVPVGGDVVLEIADTGAGQRRSETYSLSLRTGKLEAGDVSVVDQLHGDDVLVSDAFQIGGLTPPDQGEGVNCRVEIEPRSHRGTGGPARDGHMWLEVEVTVTFARYEDWMAAEHATLEVDLAASVTIVDENGDRLPLDLESRTATPPENYPGGDPPAVTASQTARIEVPDTLREFTVTFRLQATFHANDGGVLGYQRYDHDNVGTITLTES